MFQSSYSETAYSLVCLLMKGNKLTAGNENNDSAIQVDRPGRISARGLPMRFAMKMNYAVESNTFHVEIVENMERPALACIL